MPSKKHYLYAGVILFLCLGLFAPNILRDNSETTPTLSNTNHPASELAKEKRHISSTSGKEAYQRVCAQCHNANGLGLPEVFPPIKGSEWTQNDLLIANIILRGVSGTIEVSGQRYASAMGSMASQVTDAEIVSIIQYIQEEFNERPSSIGIEQVTHIRQQQLQRISSQSGLEALRNHCSSLSAE